MGSRIKRQVKQLGETVASVIEKLSYNGEFCGCEVGVWKGDTSKQILKIHQSLFLHMIDTWDLPDIQMRVKEQVIVDKAKEEAISNTEFAKSRREIMQMPSLEAANKFDVGSLDFVFIDANHLYEHVKNDLHVWFTKVKIGGIFLGHDYNGRQEKKGGWGVKKAVDEFAKNNNLDVKLHPSQIWSIYK